MSDPPPLDLDYRVLNRATQAERNIALCIASGRSIPSTALLLNLPIRYVADVSEAVQLQRENAESPFPSEIAKRGEGMIGTGRHNNLPKEAAGMRVYEVPRLFAWELE